MQWLRSAVFASLLNLSILVWGLFSIVLRLFGYPVFYAAISGWSRGVLAMLRIICRLDCAVTGRENLPDTNCIVLMKHSSAWETIAQLALLPRQTWVLKRELMWLPVFGWVLFFLRPIAINRKAGRAAVEQVISQGRQRLDDGLWVVIFPEGTRVPAGQKGRFGLSGTLLAQAAGRPVVPVAHNAGYFWARRSLLKRPGTIQFEIGQPIDVAGRDPREVNAEIQAWIESALERMPTS